MATVYTVASAKGGVGKTTTAAAIATLLADAGASVVAIDADLGMANLAGALGIDVEGETVHDVLAGRADPEAAVQEGPRGLRVLPGETDLDAYADADPAGLADVVAAFADADYVVLDAGAGLSHDSALPLALADRTLLVSTPEREALRDTAKTGELADRLGGTVDGAVITRVDPDDPHGHDDLIVSHLDVPIHERIPEDEAVGAAVAAGEPLVVFAPSAPATRGYRSLTERLTDVDLPEPESAVADDDAAGRGTDAVDDEPDAGPEPTATAGSTADVEMTVGDLTESSEDETDETDAVKADEADADEENEVDADEAEAEAEEATVDQPTDPVIRDAEDEDTNEHAADETSIKHDEIDGIAEATESEGSTEPPEAAQPDADVETGTDERTEADEDAEESIDGSEAVDDPNDSGVESVPFREDADAEPTSTGSARRPDRDDEDDAEPGDGRDDVGDGSEADGESGDDESGDDGSESDGGGFFSRLLGR